MKKILLSLAVLAALLVGCQEAPENVKEDVKKLDADSSQSDSNSSDKVECKEYGTIEEIRNQLDNDIKNNETRFKVDSARVGTGTKMPTYNVKISGLDLKSQDKEIAFKNLSMRLFGSEYIDSESAYSFSDKNEIIRTGDSNSLQTDFWLNDEGKLLFPNNSQIDIKVYCPDKEENTSALVAHSTGCVYGAPNGIEDCCEPINDIVYQVGNDDLNVEYAMSDGESWKISDAITFAEDYMNCKDMMDFEPSKCSYEVQYVYVIPIENNKYAYDFSFSRKDDNGNYLDTLDYFIECGYEQEEIRNNNPYYMGCVNDLFCLEKNKIYNFSKGYSLNYLDETNSGDKLLTLNGALTILEDSLAKQLTLNIGCAELSYGLSCKGYPVFVNNKEHLDESVSVIDYYDDIYCLTNCEFELKPVWVFKTENYRPLSNAESQIYYVDAITGEVIKLK